MRRPQGQPLSVDPRPAVRLAGIEKRYAGGTLALAGLDMSVAPGEFLSLLGPSGCGKSTALRLIAGLSQPNVGTVERMDGAIGFVFQEPTLMPWARVIDNVLLPLRLEGRNLAESRDRAAEALAQVGLKGFERSFPRQLSGGMRMRVSIARGLVTAPALLLMDEPFAALDEITRLKLNDDLLALAAARKLTVIFVTHSVYESVYLSSRILVMTPRPGRISHDIAIEAGYPRGREFRHGSQYADYCRIVSEALEQAMAGAA